MAVAGQIENYFAQGNIQIAANGDIRQRALKGSKPAASRCTVIISTPARLT